MRTYIVLGSCFSASLLAAHGCRYSEVDLAHCGNQEGDAYCAEQFPDGSRSYCELGAGSCISSNAQLGCVAERPADECYSPCGGRSTIDENGECVTVESSSSGTSSGGTDTEASSSTGESSSTTTGPMPCASDEECTDPDAPFCGTNGECGTCDGSADPDAACAGFDPTLPLCVGGACVQCTAAAPEACTGTTPLCDDATNTCVPCTEHGQCGEAACNLYTGACLPGDADAIAHVGPGQEFVNLTLAVASIPADAEGTVVVHQANYDEAVTVSGNRMLAFLAADGDAPTWAVIAGGMPQLTVPMGSTVLMDGLRLSGNANDVGLRVDGGRAWVDQSRIVQNTGGGILAENAAELTLRSSFVGGNEDVDAIFIDGSRLDMLYTTGGGGNGAFGEARALSCAAGSDVTVRSSIIVAIDDVPELACIGATITNTATETAVVGSGNQALGPIQATWFTNYAQGDFSLADPPTAVAMTAVWTTGDPLTDIDGDPRPAVDGTPDYAGADVP